MKNSYEWQDQVFDLWKNNKFTGVIKAVTSAGKTIAGVKTIDKYLSENPYDRVWIIANTKEVVGQWKRESEAYDWGKSVEFYTYPSAVTKMHQYDRDAKLNLLPDVMILDECHCTLANVWGQVMDFGVPKYLGLSATPNGSEKKLGGIIQTVGWDKANVADATVHLVKFKPSDSEISAYIHKSDIIDAYRERHPGANYKNDQRLSWFYLQRRRLTYGFKGRDNYAIELIKKNKDRNVMVFCYTHKQAHEIADKCKEQGIKCALHLSNHEELDVFTSGEVNVCISCKKLSTGFSYPKADVAIIVSPNTTELALIQEIGRVIRPMDGKHADIYILIAKDTSDEEILRKNIFQKEKIEICEVTSLLQ